MTIEELKQKIAELGQRIENLKNRGLDSNAQYTALVETYHLLTKELYECNGPDVYGIHNYVDSNVR